MKFGITRLGAAFLAIGFAMSARAASDIVLIDFGEPAYTVYAGLPAERSNDVKAKIANQPAQLVSFSEFSEGRSKFIGGKIVIDDYQGMRAEEGIVELVRKYPGTPFGITWNGGLRSPGWIISMPKPSLRFTAMMRKSIGEVGVPILLLIQFTR